MKVTAGLELEKNIARGLGSPWLLIGGAGVLLYFFGGRIWSLLTSAGNLLGIGTGLVSTATQGLAYTIEAGKEGVEMVVQYMGDQFYFNGTGGMIVEAMQDEDISAQAQIQILDMIDSGQIPGWLQPFADVLTVEAFEDWWFSIMLDSTSSNLEGLHDYASDQWNQLHQWNMNHA